MTIDTKSKPWMSMKCGEKETETGNSTSGICHRSPGFEMSLILFFFTPSGITVVFSSFCRSKPIDDAGSTEVDKSHSLIEGSYVKILKIDSNKMRGTWMLSPLWSLARSPTVRKKHIRDSGRTFLVNIVNSSPQPFSHVCVLDMP